MSRTSRPQSAQCNLSVRGSAKPVRRPTAVRGGFTLVEMMVVIAILALLTALLVPAIFGAISRARNAAMSLEMAGIAAALERYKQEYGEYPPDFSTDAGLQHDQIHRHLAAIFRYRVQKLSNDPDVDLPLKINGATKNDIIDVGRLDPGEALYFWLRGFSANPSRPVGGIGTNNIQLPITGAGDRSPIFDFDQTRLTDVDFDGIPEYKPRYVEQQGVINGREQYAPYVYFRDNRPYSANGWSDDNGSFGHAVPYASAPSATVPAGFAARDKFQIVCAGQDGLFASDPNTELVLPFRPIPPIPQYPDGAGYTPADNDNLTTFAEGSTLEDAKP